MKTREQLDREDRRQLGRVGSLTSREKRRKEDDIQQGRRKKLKYGLLGADWGEETTTSTWREPPNTTSTPIPREQDLDHSTRELEDQPHLVMAPLPQREPRNRQRKQGSIASFLEQKTPPPTIQDLENGGGERVDMEKACVDVPLTEHERSIKGVDINIVPTNHTPDPECNFKRGKCLTHNLKGIQKKIKERKWVKKKNGIFGYSTINSIMYTCMARKEALVEPKISTNPDQSLISADLGIKRNILNITSLSLSENKQDKSESLQRESFGD